MPKLFSPPSAPMAKAVTAAVFTFCAHAKLFLLSAPMAELFLPSVPMAKLWLPDDVWLCLPSATILQAVDVRPCLPSAPMAKLCYFYLL
eukprot:g16265.t1